MTIETKQKTNIYDNYRVALEEAANTAYAPYTLSIDASQITFSCTSSIPTIKDVTIIHGNEGENRGVIVEFADGMKQKAVANGNDIFSFETGISICLTKRLLDKVTNNRGHQTYNKIIRDAVKVYEDKLKREETKKLEEELINNIKARRALKKAERKKRREALAREARIQEYAEAYARAFNMVADNKQ